MDCFLVSGAIALQNQLESMYETGDFCDFEVRVENRVFKVHKNVLAARSSTLASMLLHDMMEKKTGMVEIGDCDSETFQAFLKFLYTGKSDVIAAENAASLFEVADKYDVQYLKKKCHHFMMNNFSVESFCEFAILALRHDDWVLVQVAKMFLRSNINAIVSSEQLHNLFTENPSFAGDSLFKLSADSVQCLISLYEVADKYNVQDLKIDCRRCLMQSLSVESFCDVAILAVRYDERELIQLAAQFLRNNITEIFSSMEWDMLLTYNPSLANELVIQITGETIPCLIGWYEVTDIYAVKNLNTLCNRCTLQILSVESFCDIAIFAVENDERELIKRTAEFLRSNMNKIFLSVEWQIFFTGNPTLASELLIKLSSGTIQCLISLYEVADKYDVQDLKTQCRRFMIQNLTVESFCDVAVLAVKHGEQKLIGRVAEFLRNNMNEIFSSVQWEIFLTENPSFANELVMKISAGTVECFSKLD